MSLGSSRVSEVQKNPQHGGFRGALVLRGNTFEQWADLSQFSETIQEMCEILAIRSGLDIRADHDALKAAHTRWRRKRRQWLVHYLPESTEELSHLKLSALLIDSMCEAACVTVSAKTNSQHATVGEGALQDGMDGWSPLPNQLSELSVRMLQDGGVHYISMMVAFQVCEHYERNRQDLDGQRRIDDFVDRRTREFDIDFVSALLGKQVSAQAIHIILKALYLRD